MNSSERYFKDVLTFCNPNTNPYVKSVNIGVANGNNYTARKVSFEGTIGDIVVLNLLFEEIDCTDHVVVPLEWISCVSVRIDKEKALKDLGTTDLPAFMKHFRDVARRAA